MSTNPLFHISDVPGIKLFEPRPALSLSGIQDDVVWAIDRAHLHNYLLPRDCPRVTFYAGASNTSRDIEQLIGSEGARHVVAIESGWLRKLREERLYIYEFEPETFHLHDATAGYYLSRQSVTPMSEQQIDDILDALLERDVELRIMPSLWELREAVADSSLEFSIIRMRNAAPPPEGFVSRYPCRVNRRQ